MTSTIHSDKIMNSSGDQDSGVDLLVNDQVKIKTANTDRITVTDSAASMGDINLNRASNTSTTPNGAIEYNHTDNAMYIKAGGTTSMTIDSTGRILTPARPCFSARKNRASGGATGYQGDPLVFDTEKDMLNLLLI